MREGTKVRLRPKSPDDARRDWAWSQDTELARLDGIASPYISFADFLQAYLWELKNPLPGRERFAIETLGGTHIGNCMYYDLDQERGEAEVGILIGENHYWDQGYGTEAMALLLEHLFTSGRVKSVRLHTLKDNPRAQRCFQKCGFKAQGLVFRQNRTFLLMRLSREEWEAGRTARD